MTAAGEESAADFHVPVLGSEVVEFVRSAGPGTILDGTVGGGGHARLLLEALPDCSLLASDRDPEALAVATRALRPFEGRVRLVHARFDEVVARAAIPAGSLAAALLDLGVSTHQLDRDERGFSFRRGVPLDARMDPTEGHGVADLLRDSSEAELSRFFREYGDEPRARRLAREVVRRRDDRPFRRSDDLVAVLSAVLGRPARAREKARVFQALRMACNDEEAALRDALPRIRDALRDGGVFCVIAYHSVEDALAKHAFREWSIDCVCPPDLPVCGCDHRSLGESLTRRPVRPHEDEVTRNPRARSARLRAWRRIHRNAA